MPLLLLLRAVIFHSLVRVFIDNSKDGHVEIFAPISGLVPSVSVLPHEIKLIERQVHCLRH